MSKLIIKFFDLIEKLGKENPSVLLVLFLLSFLLNVLLCWLLYKVYKWFRKEQKKLESEREKSNDEKIDKARAEEKLAASEKQLQESRNQVIKLQVKLGIKEEGEKSHLKERITELEGRLKQKEIEELKKKIEELKKNNQKE